MAVLELRLYPDPVLKQIARPVEEFGLELERFVLDLQESMRAHGGIGLAAPQVGVSQRIAVVDLDPGGPGSHPYVLVNPEVVFQEAESWNRKVACRFQVSPKKSNVRNEW